MPTGLSGDGKRGPRGRSSGALSDPEWSELAEYLGPAFNPEYCANTSSRLAEEFVQYDDEAEFYAHSQIYLYDLAAFAASVLKKPFRGLVKLVAPRGAHLLDYGCGSGSDGLRFLEQGYQVSFADFKNPSTEYLLWRLSRRNHVAPFFNVREDVIPAHDVAYAFDVLEHVDDPIAVVNRLSKIARVVVVNLVTTPDYARTTFPMHRNHDWHRVLRTTSQEHHLICAFQLAHRSWYQLAAFRRANTPALSRRGEYLARAVQLAPLRIRFRLLGAVP